MKTTYNKKKELELARQKYSESTVKKDKKISPRVAEVLQKQGYGMGTISKMGKTTQRIFSLGNTPPQF